MKKTAVLFCAVLPTVLLWACGSKLDVEKNTVALQKNGTVLEAAVETFSESYYSEEELESYIEENVGQYTQENGKKAVSVADFEVDGETAYLTLKYKSAEVFADFTGDRCFAGSVVEAQSAGFDFDTEFYAVEDGTAQEASVSPEEVLKSDELKVFIVQGNSDIIVPGKIAYVSREGTGVSASDTVTVTAKEKDTDEAILAYVLYQ